MSLPKPDIHVRLLPDADAASRRCRCAVPDRILAPEQPRLSGRVSEDRLQRSEPSSASRSTYFGMRVSIHAGLRAGMTGTVLRACSARQYEVILDGGGRARVLRTAVLPLGPVPERAPRGVVRGEVIGSVERRVEALFARDAALARVVVYRTDSGRTCVRPWREQEVGPGLIGVYARGVDLAKVAEDLLA